MDERFRSADGYRKRAAELRAEVETLSDDDARRMLVDVAVGYERLAQSLERKTRAPKDV